MAADDENKRSTALWVAITGAFVTAVGYLAVYFQETQLQARQETHDLLIKLLREDPRDSQRNLLWAHDAGLLVLSEQTVVVLREDPFSAPTRAEQLNSQSIGDPYAVPASTIGLIRNLEAPRREDRARAVQTLLDNSVGDEPTVIEVVNFISEDELSDRTVAGRYNALFFLERVDWEAMPSEMRERTLAVLEAIRNRAAEGVSVVGEQTAQLLDDVEASITSATSIE